MYCPKCGEKVKSNQTHCKKCGNKLKNTNTIEKPQKTYDKYKIGIIVLIVIVVALLIGVLYAGGVFNREIPLENKDFGAFRMDVPVGSSFEEFASFPSTNIGGRNIGGFIFLQNVGEHSEDFYMLCVSNLPDKWPDQFEFERKDGDIVILRDKDAQTNLYYVTRETGGFNFGLMGNNPDLLVKMLRTVQITDANALSQNSSSGGSSSVNVPTTTSDPAPTPAPSSTPSSISILGGSFSTGSELEDKTYARINVGTAHAGENVIVQIFYSRDGSNLNNGNMVPATVHSDGYLEIASADAYSLYPDHATINIYDSNSRLLTSRSVSLMPASGTQTF